MKGPPGTRSAGDSATFPMRCTHEKSGDNKFCDRCRTIAHQHDQRINASDEARKRERAELCANLNELVYGHADPVDGFEDIWGYLLSYTTLYGNNLRT